MYYRDKDIQEQKDEIKKDHLKQLGMRIKIALTRNKATKNGISSQIELAEKLQVKATTISDYMRGNKAPTFVNLIQIAQLLNVSTDWLLGLEENCPSIGIIRKITAYDIAHELLCMEPTLGLIPSSVQFKDGPLKSFFEEYKEYTDAVKESGNNEKTIKLFNSWLEQALRELKEIEIK